MTSSILIGTEGAVRVLTLNRPRRRNALDTAAAQELLDALRDAQGDSALGAVVLTGTGTVFCSGADMTEFRDIPNVRSSEHRSDLFLELLLVLEKLTLPLVCAAEGGAIGMGAALLNAADMTVLAERAWISYPELPHGMVPSLMIPMVFAAVGARRGFEILALGDNIDARSALSCGLANQVVEDGQALDQALTLAQRLAGFDRAMMRETKRLCGAMRDLSLPDALRFGRESARRTID